jgi:arginine N-succinyltransferase
MSYRDADQLSRKNKDFIKNLFPSEDIYTGLFTEKARQVIGKTGSETMAAQSLLERIGFSYLNAVDPFDGGPHLEAKRKEIGLIKRLSRYSMEQIESLPEGGSRGIFSFCSNNSFYSSLCYFREDSNGKLHLDAASLQALEQFSDGIDDNRLFIVTLL